MSEPRYVGRDAPRVPTGGDKVGGKARSTSTTSRRAGHAARQDQVQRARPRPHPAHRHLARRARCPACAPSSPATTRPSCPHRLPARQLRAQARQGAPVPRRGGRGRGHRSRHRAEAVDLIEVEYEPLPGVFSPEEALAEGAPLVHELDPAASRGRATCSRCYSSTTSGDLAAPAERASAFVAEGEFSVPRIQQSCMGTAGCIAEFDLTRQPHDLGQDPDPLPRPARLQPRARGLGLEGPQRRAWSSSPRSAAGFGTGLDTHATSTSRSCWPGAAASRSRSSTTARRSSPTCRRGSRRRRASARAATTTGKLTFRELEVVQDNGAYTSWGADLPQRDAAAGDLALPRADVRFDAKIVYTNNTYCQAMRGYGNPEVTWPIESNLDELAEQAGIDPLEHAADQLQPARRDSRRWG